MADRIDFSEKTKKQVAGRVAYRCCYPRCDKPTIGPGAESFETALTGRASHIFSASPGGPRGQGGLTDDQLCSPENAIWLCSEHATLVDTNRGDRFPPALLLPYKAVHEARVAREQGGIFSPMGWIHEITIHQSPIFLAHSKIHFGKVTVIQGDNGFGKTALCQWIEGLGNPTALARWNHPRNTRERLRFSVIYDDPEEHNATLEIEDNRAVGYSLGGRAVPYLPIRVNVVHLRKCQERRAEESHDELSIISEALGCHTSVVRNVMPALNTINEGSVRNFHCADEDGTSLVKAEHCPHTGPVGFRAMSDSEQAKVLIEIAVAVARFSAEYMPTMLLIDTGIASLDAANFARYAQYFSLPQHNFQTVMCLTRAFPTSQIQWSGWEFVRLGGTKQNVSVDQSPF